MKIIQRNVFYCFLLVLLIGCGSAAPVAFETLVDTKTKEITYQEKKTYTIDDLGIHASNNFDGARLNGFRKENDSTALAIIQPENEPINNSAYYAFKIWSENPKQLYLKFQYPEGYKHRYIPKIKRNGTWKIIDTSQVYNKNGVTTIKINEIDRTPIIIAAQEIQTSKGVEQWYTSLVAGKENYVRLKSFGKSRLGKNLPVLDIYKGDKKNKDIIVLLTRQHPPEITGYYAFQEFLKTILTNSQLSDNFLKKYRILAFPIMNPDGVDLGNWRHNAGGVDTNRDWSVYNQPEIRQAVNFIDKQSKNDEGKIVLGLDFHSTYEDVFYTNKIREGTTLPTFIDDWFQALENNIPNYKVNEASGNSKKPVSKGWFLYGHKAVGITYEIGDATSKENIALIGKVSAEQMMNLLTNNN